MNLHNRLKKLERMQKPAGGGVAVVLTDGRVQYRGKIFPGMAALPPGGYLLTPGMLTLETWQEMAGATWPV